MLGRLAEEGGPFSGVLPQTGRRGNIQMRNLALLASLCADLRAIRLVEGEMRQLTAAHLRTSAGRRQFNQLTALHSRPDARRRRPMTRLRLTNQARFSKGCAYTLSRPTAAPWDYS